MQLVSFPKKLTFLINNHKNQYNTKNKYSLSNSKKFKHLSKNYDIYLFFLKKFKLLMVVTRLSKISVCATYVQRGTGNNPSSVIAKSNSKE